MRARFTSAIALLGAVLGIAAAPLGAVVVPLGQVFRLDAAPDCSEREPDLAPLPNGGFVAVWTGGSHVHARIFDAAGTPAGPAVQVDSPAGQANATVAAVATATDGSFLVVWHDDIRDQITSRLFSAAGAPLGTACSSPTTAATSGSSTRPTWSWWSRRSTAGRSTGKFWFFYGALTNVEYDIRVRHFSGAEKTYHNPPFQFLSRADTAAFTPTNCPCLPVAVPVCGKDGVTYGNECQARCVGFVEVAHPGAC